MDKSAQIAFDSEIYDEWQGGDNHSQKSENNGSIRFVVERQASDNDSHSAHHEKIVPFDQEAVGHADAKEKRALRQFTPPQTVRPGRNR